MRGVPGETAYPATAATHRRSFSIASAICTTSIVRNGATISMDTGQLHLWKLLSGLRKMRIANWMRCDSKAHGMGTTCMFIAVRFRDGNAAPDLSSRQRHRSSWQVPHPNRKGPTSSPFFSFAFGCAVRQPHRGRAWALRIGDWASPERRARESPYPNGHRCHC
jgi:hypothetical protein